MNLLRHVAGTVAREATAVALEHAARALREYAVTEKPGTSPTPRPRGARPAARPDATKRVVRYEDIYPPS